MSEEHVDSSDEHGERRLDIWVVYDHPRHQPEYFVVRRQWARPDGTIEADRRSYGFRDLSRARLFLRDKGLTPLARAVEVDPAILEIWVDDGNPP